MKHIKPSTFQLELELTEESARAIFGMSLAQIKELVKEEQLSYVNNNHKDG